MTPDERQLLGVLAASEGGATEALLMAHGFTDAQIAGLVATGLATTDMRVVLSGTRPVEVTTVRISDAGRVLLERGS